MYNSAMKYFNLFNWNFVIVLTCFVLHNLQISFKRHSTITLIKQDHKLRVNIKKINYR